jgi:hypothetical protein
LGSQQELFSQISLDGRSVKLLFQRFTLTADSQERF